MRAVFVMIQGPVQETLPPKHHIVRLLLLLPYISRLLRTKLCEPLLK